MKTWGHIKLYLLRFSRDQTSRFASKSIKNRRCSARRYDVYEGRTFTFNTSSERSHDFLSRQYIISGCKILPSGRKTALKNHNFESKKCVTYDVIHDVIMASIFFIYRTTDSMQLSSKPGFVRSFSSYSSLVVFSSNLGPKRCHFRHSGAKMAAFPASKNFET